MNQLPGHHLRTPQIQALDPLPGPKKNMDTIIGSGADSDREESIRESISPLLANRRSVLVACSGTAARFQLAMMHTNDLGASLERIHRPSATLHRPRYPGSPELVALATARCRPTHKDQVTKLVSTDGR